MVARSAAPLVAIGAALALAPGADGAARFGANDVITPGTQAFATYNPNEAAFQKRAPLTLGYAAPFDGVIVRWRVQIWSGPSGTIKLRPLHPLEGGSLRPLSTTPERVTPGSQPTLFSFPVRLAVSAGDLLGIDSSNGGTGNVINIAERAVSRSDVGTMAATPDGGMGAAAGEQLNTELITNADIEPDADRDGFGDETQDKCRPTARGRRRAPRRRSSPTSRVPAFGWAAGP